MSPTDEAHSLIMAAIEDLKQDVRDFGSIQREMGRDLTRVRETVAATKMEVGIKTGWISALVSGTIAALAALAMWMRSA